MLIPICDHGAGRFTYKTWPFLRGRQIFHNVPMEHLGKIIEWEDTAPGTRAWNMHGRCLEDVRTVISESLENA